MTGCPHLTYTRAQGHYQRGVDGIGRIGWSLRGNRERVEGSTPRQLASLTRAVAVAALPATEQEAWLGSIGLDWLNVDEIGMEIGDGTLLALQFAEAGWLPPQTLEQLQVLDAFLEKMSGEANSDLWTLEALQTAPEWVECRRLALRVLLSVN